MYKSLSDKVVLNNGVKMPVLGFGVFKVPDDDTARCVELAIRTGYESIDTAAIYQNERGVGEGIRNSGVPREKLFITTKVWNADHGFESTLEAFSASIKKLRVDYLDLYLIHWPVPRCDKFVETWKAMEKLCREGVVRAIGVSNFNAGHIDELLSKCETVPAVNQIELHPWLSQNDLCAYLKSKKIFAEAWSPLARGGELLKDQSLLLVANKYGKTPAQVVLRWHLQRDVIVIPKTIHQERMAQNADVFDFALSSEDMATIDRLNKDHRIGPDPDTFDIDANC